MKNNNKNSYKNNERDSNNFNYYIDDEESQVGTANFFQPQKIDRGSYYEQCMLMTIEENGIDPIAFLKFN